MEASAAALWLNTAFAGFDSSITLAVHTLYSAAGVFFTPFFNFISFLGKDGIILIIASVILLLYKPTRKYGTAMAISLIIDVLIINCFLKVVIARPRPYADPSGIYYQLWQLVGMATESDKSFPSGHTGAAFATMTAIFFVGNKRYSWTAFIFGILMGISRIYLVVHYPTDVIAGAIVGFIAGYLASLIFFKIPTIWLELDLFAKLPWNKKKGAHECSK